MDSISDTAQVSSLGRLVGVAIVVRSDEYFDYHVAICEIWTAHA